MSAAWVLLLILKNPGDVHGSSMRVALPTQAACMAARDKALASNAAIVATGYHQQMVAVCVEPRS